ncbi:MAG TPA: VOC family protein [Candidatus Dormibacteraeota bacterium]|nr:VOC family protein [Candidatus Dormibacteraeota bacterium]
MFSRRFLLAATTAFALAPRFAIAKDEVPSSLDHILLGCDDLDHGIAFVEQHTRVRAAFGGIHPGRGTRNALLALGERRYLEIIAPDPQQPNAPDNYGLQKLDEPRLITWAAHSGNIQALADRLATAGIAAEGPTPGSRKRPDGQLLQWQTLNLKDNANGLLPFFIEWSADSPHPSVTAQRGCHLANFEILTPDPDALTKTAKQLGLDVAISKGNTAQLRATISCAGRDLILTS